MRILVFGGERGERMRFTHGEKGRPVPAADNLHCLHASMLTTLPPFFAAAGALAFLFAAGLADFFAFPVSALAGAALAGEAAFLEDARVVLAMVNVCDDDDNDDAVVGARLTCYCVSL